MSAIELSSSAGSGDLFELNDHCVILIFKELNLYDSVSLANTCPRFDFIFRQHVIQSKKLEFKGLKRRFINWLDIFERLLISYGPQLRHLEMDNYTYAPSLDQVLFSMMNDHCNTGNLRSLSLEGVEIGSDFVRESSEILHGLRSLTIEHCRVNEGSLGELLAKCSQLEHLTLRQYDVRYGTRQLDPLLRITTPNLRSITLAFCGIDIEVDTLKLLFAKTARLQTFDYREINMQQKNLIPYDVIAAMLPNLRKLRYNIRLDQNIENIEQLGAMPSLRTLKMVAVPAQERQLVHYLRQAAQVGQLEALSILSHHQTTHSFTEFSHQLCRLTSLRKLKLSQMPNVTSRIVEIAAKLPLLQKLSIDEISTADCGLNRKQMLRLFEVARNVRKVKFHFIASSQGERNLPIDLDLINEIREIVRKREQSARSLQLRFCCTRYDTFKYIDELLRIDCERCQCKQYLG